MLLKKVPKSFLNIGLDKLNPLCFNVLNLNFKLISTEDER